MAYNRPDPSVHRGLSAEKSFWHAFCLTLIQVFVIFAIFFIQLWGYCQAICLNAEWCRFGFACCRAILDLQPKGSRKNNFTFLCADALVPGCVAKAQKYLDIPALRRLARQAPQHLKM